MAYRSFVTDQLVRNSRVGRRIPELCEWSGLAVRHVAPVTAVYRKSHDADQVFDFLRTTQRAVEAGYLSSHEAGRWLDHLRTGTFFASISLFVTLAER